MTDTAIYAAGGVVWRVVDETAVREIFEETGIRVALGVNVGISRYNLPSKGQKIVHYWSAEATDAAIRSSSFVPNREIAAIEWMTPKKALKRLSYPVDVEILENFLKFVDDGILATFPIIVLRHAKALTRDEWKGADHARPLNIRGRKQANAAVGQLLAFGPRKLISSPAVRCVKTVTPLSAALGRPIDRTPLISQDAWEEGASDARRIVGERVRSRKAAVLCSHGPVLPEILTELALATGTLRGSYLGSASARGSWAAGFCCPAPQVRHSPLVCMPWRWGPEGGALLSYLRVRFLSI